MTALDLQTASPTAPATAAPYRVSVEQYITFRKQGFLVVRGLVSPAEIAELRTHIEDLTQGRLPEQSGHLLANGDHSSGVATQELAAPPAHLSPEEKADFFLRIHMLHRHLELHERYLLHPRVLDVLQALIGPDILALQTMLFVKGPGKPGQGWHQDSYYIPTHPDSLCGAWIAIDDCDERNGAIWYASGSQHEPVYPPTSGYGFGDRNLEGISGVSGVSNPNDDENDLSPIADRYPHLLASATAGDVVFFGGHVLHRSKTNWTTDRFRRSFVGHYCNARSFTQWNDGDGSDLDPETMMANQRHILARGDTHLPFGAPRFGTPCAALLPAEERRRESEFAAMMMGDMESGMMGAMDADPTMVDDD
ncbi:MAG: Phytanoyl-CoA dioxygenase, peroxisomal precursor [uncultured Thermomicrobiales bacterium]|uniref:Phytanoyl-CoA dioxygenase, peroxisomal n=1 Tax=uncultured Thermomicrobiales bacterium TaxID=1645740 RepID=A0A6J4V210_9BACT|nr:MAG: Phytanoyl-CoA dioxygenase, peroxisomal precursor [uncultured Thermomicrobiales bacterium]